MDKKFRPQCYIPKGKGAIVKYISVDDPSVSITRIGLSHWKATKLLDNNEAREKYKKLWRENKKKILNVSKIYKEEKRK